MLNFAEKLNDVSIHLENGDFNLGFRKLTDCVLDTENFEIYQRFIEFTEWKESHVPSKDILYQKLVAFLNSLKSINVPFEQKVNLLEAQQVFKKYKRGNFQLGEIDLKLKQGDVWGLVGENGNGKTTLLRILAHDLAADKGEILYLNDEHNLDEYNLRSKLAYIPQRTPKWYGSLKSNLKFTAAQYGIKGEENEIYVNMMIIRFGLWNFRNHNWDELSSGYKMRFELARTFLRKPSILLLDEPLANLDVVAQQIILEDLKNMAQSLANPIGIVLSSQQLFEVEKVANKVLFLRNGVPTFLSDANQQDESLCYVEVDIQCEREHLNQALLHLPIKSINFNGGLYLITLDDENGFNHVLSALIQHQIEIKYARNISRSTKRLFI